MPDEIRAALADLVSLCERYYKELADHDRRPHGATPPALARARAALAQTPPAGEGELVYVLQSLEPGGYLELDGVFRDLERAKHHLEDRYPFLQAWRENTVRLAGGEMVTRWESDTGKHGVVIEQTFLDREPAPTASPPAGEEARERVISAAREWVTSAAPGFVRRDNARVGRAVDELYAAVEALDAAHWREPSDAGAYCGGCLDLWPCQAAGESDSTAESERRGPENEWQWDGVTWEHKCHPRRVGYSEMYAGSCLTCGEVGPPASVAEGPAGIEPAPDPDWWALSAPGGPTSDQTCWHSEPPHECPHCQAVLEAPGYIPDPWTELEHLTNALTGAMRRLGVTDHLVSGYLDRARNALGARPVAAAGE